MPYKRGDVVLIDVPIPKSGHVQGGKRPWIIVQNDKGNRYSPTSIVVPLTTKFKRMEMPTHVPVIYKNLIASVAECEQVRVIDVTSDWKYLCTLPRHIMANVDRALENAFFYGGGVNPKRSIRREEVKRYVDFDCVLCSVRLVVCSGNPRNLELPENEESLGRAG